jgi:hypothetical protein
MGCQCCCYTVVAAVLCVLACCDICVSMQIVVCICNAKLLIDAVGRQPSALQCMLLLTSCTFYNLYLLAANTTDVLGASAAVGRD